jgi:outer membrane protein TolC
MKPACTVVPRVFLSSLAFSILFFAASPIYAESLTLKRAVDLALVHSPAAGQAAADEQRALAAYRETRDQFIPQLFVGSGLGDSWGYPLSLEGAAPSLVNITAQSALFSPALRDGLHAARSEYDAAKLGGKDRHNQIVQDTTLAYLELLKWQQQLGALQQQQDDAAKIEQVVEQRIQQGIDSQEQRVEARLSTARAKLRLAQAQSAIDELRSTISQLTGLPAGSIDAIAESVPALPEASSEPDAPARVVESNPAIEFAQQHAAAQAFKARAEHLALLPSVDFASQYAVLAKFNNWLQFFPTKAFERNNATIGVVIRFPFFSTTQRAHAQAADAEAIRARSEVESTKNQISQEALKLQHSVQQLSAAKEVAELEYEIAKSDADSVDIRMNSGNATVHDAANARLQMAAKYNALQDADFQLLRARIVLMRMTGELEGWAEQTK